MAMPDMAPLKLRSFCAHGRTPPAEEASAHLAQHCVLNCLRNYLAVLPL